MKWILTTLFFLSTFLDGFNRVANINTNIEEAYHSFFAKDYKKAIGHFDYLHDSLLILEEGIHLNKGHAQYFLTGLSGLSADINKTAPDTLYIGAANNTYSRLWIADDENIASRAFNQSGLLAFKAAFSADGFNEEQTIDQSLSYFKSALLKDPSNENARYNYELLRKYKEFPEQVMEQVRKLVKQRRYVDAYVYITETVKSASRLQKHQEYIKRLEDIVKIETGYTE
ncbi:MAG: hypothetical protein OEX02_08460 [Cyclobacteriaceae bacterium]|nr:hypothetical protein [Cyclobacteriaceae bacterium]